ncbi:MAG TPA: class I SAM-dependent methyltransferase [Smithella sp.]|nr:class I SAM-dependent methyltransferase [Smithella sp.]
MSGKDFLQSQPKLQAELELLPTDVFKARLIKILGFTAWSNPSIWIDASFKIDCDLNVWWDRKFRSPFTAAWHPFRDCVYDEAEACILNKRDSKEVIMAELSEMPFVPQNNGMIASGILMRENNLQTQTFCVVWWEFLSKHSHRDQIAFAVPLWLYKKTFHGIQWDYRKKKDFIHMPHIQPKPVLLKSRNASGINDHTDLLNYLAKKYNLQRYLEIGVQNPNSNFNKINVTSKIGVDPYPTFKQFNIEEMTSDEFFEDSKANFDLIFIDGLHHAEQVERDFENSMHHLSAGGFIVLHDCNPEFERHTSVPRKEKGKWLGDVYKFISVLSRYQGIEYRTLNMDNGCCVVWRSQVIKATMNKDWRDITWKQFVESGPQMINLVSVDDFIRLI